MSAPSQEQRPTPKPGRAPSAPPQRWCIITCEYPPMRGGVADYTLLLARAMVAAGDTVEVYAPPAPAPPSPADGVTVHVLPSLFGFDALRVLRRALKSLPPDARVLVQYVPTGYGMRMMNVPFAMLLFSQRRRLDVYFHEVGFQLSPRETTRRNLAGVVHLLMNWLTLRGAARVFIAIPEWQSRLRRLGVGVYEPDRPVTWVPVPSNVPDEAPEARVRELRAALLPTGTTRLIGHFGTYGRYHESLLPPLFIRLLDTGPDRAAVLIGRNGAVMRSAIVSARPDLASRLHATGGLPGAEVSAHLAACDVLVQPYDDGVSARRGSLMAGLALGRPVATNRGSVTGALWLRRDIVQLASTDGVDDLAAVVDTLLADPVRRATLGRSAQLLHNELFALQRGVTRLRNATSYAEPLVERAPARPQSTESAQARTSTVTIAQEPRVFRGPRVLMLHTTLPTPDRKPGGVEVAVHRLATALVRLGVSVTVASLSEAPAGATYAHRRLFPHIAWMRDTNFGRLLVLPLLLNFMRIGDADVVHFHGDDWFVLRRPRATVRTIHGSALREAQMATRWRRKLMQYAVFPLERLASRLATIAVAVGEDAAELHGLSRVIGNGVDPELFHPGEKSAVPQVLYVGTWDGRKRGQWMYDLFTSYIAPRHPTVELRFMADVAPPSHPRVRFERFPDDAALAQAYRESWVFALPSTYEGFGIPYLEAMASGTPVLATPNTGATHLLGNGRFGVLADDGIYDDALLRLLGDGDARARIAAAGLSRANEFTWDNVARAYLDVYTDAMRMRDGLRLDPASAGDDASDGVRMKLAPAEPDVHRVRTGVARGITRLPGEHPLAAAGEDRLQRWYSYMLEGAASVVDVGAGDGSALVFALSRAPIQQLVAFEPDRSRRDGIRRILAPNGLATDSRLSLRALRVGADAGEETVTLASLIPEMRWPLVIRIAADAATDALAGAQRMIEQDSTRWLVGITPETRVAVTAQFRDAGYVTRVMRTGMMKHTRRWLLAWHSTDTLSES